MGLSSISEAIQDIKAGRFVIIVDDENRENEGDLAIAAEKITAGAVSFMTLHARGLICLPVKGARLDDLEIPLIVRRNNSAYSTAFTTSVDAPRIISRPVFPPPTLPRQSGRWFRPRRKRTTWSNRDTFSPCAPGKAAFFSVRDIPRPLSTSRLAQFEVLAEKHSIRIVSIASIIEYRKRQERPVESRPGIVAPVLMPAN